MNKKLRHAIQYLSRASALCLFTMLRPMAVALQRRSGLPFTRKHPAASSWKTFQTKLPDKGTLELWFDGRMRDYNLGIVTGKVSGNIFVVDVDITKDGEDTLHDLQMRNDDLPETLTAVTGSGGRHFFYRARRRKHKDRNEHTWERIDTRGEGLWPLRAFMRQESHVITKAPLQTHPVVTRPCVRNVRAVVASTKVGEVRNVITTDIFGQERRTDGRKAYMAECVIGGIASHWKEKGELPMQWLTDEVYPAYAPNVVRGEPRP